MKKAKHTRLVHACHVKKGERVGDTSRIIKKEEGLTADFAPFIRDWRGGDGEGKNEKRRRRRPRYVYV